MDAAKAERDSIAGSLSACGRAVVDGTAVRHSVGHSKVLAFDERAVTGEAFVGELHTPMAVAPLTLTKEVAPAVGA